MKGEIKMLYKQCKFLDGYGDECSGLYNEERDEVICGCCGYVFKNTIEERRFVLLETYEWHNLDDAILGE